MSHHPVDFPSRKWNVSDTSPKCWFQKIRRNQTKWRDSIQKNFVFWHWWQNHKPVTNIFLYPQQSSKRGWQISEQIKIQFKRFTRRETILKMSKKIIFSRKHTQVGSRIHEPIVSVHQERTNLSADSWLMNHEHPQQYFINNIFSTRSSVSRKYCTIWCSINNTKRRYKSQTMAQRESDDEFVKYEYKSVNLCILWIKWWLFDDSFTPISIRLSIIRFGAPPLSTKIHTSSKIFVLRLFARLWKNAKSKWKAATGK